MMGADMFVVPLFIPAIAENLDTCVAQTAYIVVIFGAAYATSSPVLSGLFASRSSRAVIGGGLLVVICACVVATLSTSLVMLMLARAGSGVGAAIVNPTVWFLSATRSTKRIATEQLLPLSVAVMTTQKLATAGVCSSRCRVAPKIDRGRRATLTKRRRVAAACQTQLHGLCRSLSRIKRFALVAPKTCCSTRTDTARCAERRQRRGSTTAPRQVIPRAYRCRGQAHQSQPLHEGSESLIWPPGCSYLRRDRRVASRKLLGPANNSLARPATRCESCKRNALPFVDAQCVLSTFVVVLRANVWKAGHMLDGNE
jgi:hypothetical protein